MAKRKSDIERLHEIFNDSVDSVVLGIYRDEVNRICALRGIGKRDKTKKAKTTVVSSPARIGAVGAAAINLEGI